MSGDDGLAGKIRACRCGWPDHEQWARAVECDAGLKRNEDDIAAEQALAEHVSPRDIARLLRESDGGAA